MLTDPKLNGYLLRALNHEMAAVQQYLTQATLCGLWDLQEAAGKFQHEAKEELEHAQRLIKHMLTRGLMPNNTQLPAIRATHNLRDMLVADWHLEADVIHLYTEASQYSARIHDEISFSLFDGLLREEHEHIESIEVWLAELEPETEQPGFNRA